MSRYNEDRDILATVVYNGSWAECSERQRELVAAMVVNRVGSESFPDSVYEVVTQKGQYHPAYLGVIVTKNSQDGRYYVHEVVDANGNYIYGENKTSETAPDAPNVPGRADSIVAPDYRNATNEGLPDAGNTVTATTDANLTQSAEGVKGDLPQGLGATSYGFDPFSNLQNRADRFHPTGENPTRIVEVPTTDLQGRNISKGVQTALEAGVTPDEAVGDIEDTIVEGRFSFDTVKDKDAIARAEETIRYKGWQTAAQDWTAGVRNGNVSKDLIVLGQTLYNNAVNAGQTQEAVNILVDLVGMSRTSAQALQATRVMKTLSPEGQLYAIERSVQSYCEDLRKRLGRRFKDIKVDPELYKEFLAADSEEGRQAVREKILQNVADQVPSTWMDKWNAWRYLAMLGNSRTHIRNIAGNAGFLPVRNVR